MITSVILNLLVFTGSLYMMLVYDSVLPSGSLPTLTGLFAMLAMLYARNWTKSRLLATPILP